MKPEPTTHSDEESSSPIGRSEHVDVILPSERLTYLLAETFKILSDPTRLKIVMALQQGELCVSDLAAVVGLAQPAVSYHLKSLRQMNLVQPRRQGKSMFYSLADEHVSELLAIAKEHTEEIV